MALATGPAWFPAATPFQTALPSAPFGYTNTLDIVNQNTHINNIAWEAYQHDSRWNNYGAGNQFTGNAEVYHKEQQSQNWHQNQANDLSNYANTGGNSNQNFNSLFDNTRAGQTYKYFSQKKRKTGKKSSQNYQFSQSHKEWAKQMQKEQKEIEDQRKAITKELTNDYRAFILITLPFFFFERPVAHYFLTTKLFSILLGKLGFTDRESLFIMLFLQCVDLKAFYSGRFKFVAGYEGNWYQEIFDTIMQNLKTPDLLRYGLLYLVPQTPAPTYE